MRLFCSLHSTVGLLSSSLPWPYEEAPALVTREVSGRDIFMYVGFKQENSKAANYNCPSA